MDETAELIPIQFEKVMPSHSYTCIVLGAEDKKFAIYSDFSSGKWLQIYLSQMEKPRPFTHELMTKIFNGFEVKVRQVVINDLQDTLYFARLFLEHRHDNLLHIVEIDARPSDCITIALLHKAPIFCTRTVLEKTIPYEE